MTKKKNTPNTEIPGNETARESAKQGIEEVQKAQDTFLDAMSKAQAAFMQGGGIPGSDDFSNKTMEFMKSNMTSGFDLAKKMVDATDISEAMELQSEFARKQMEKYTEQAQEISDLVVSKTKKP